MICDTLFGRLRNIARCDEERSIRFIELVAAVPSMYSLRSVSGATTYVIAAWSVGLMAIVEDGYNLITDENE